MYCKLLRDVEDIGGCLASLTIREERVELELEDWGFAVGAPRVWLASQFGALMVTRSMEEGPWAEWRSAQKRYGDEATKAFLGRSRGHVENKLPHQRPMDAILESTAVVVSGLWDWGFADICLLVFA